MRVKRLNTRTLFKYKIPHFSWKYHEKTSQYVPLRKRKFLYRQNRMKTLSQIKQNRSKQYHHVDSLITYDEITYKIKYISLNLPFHLKTVQKF